MISVPVAEQSQVSEARREAGFAAKRLGFDDTAAGRVAIVATELATNIVKYAAPGEILVGSFEDETGTGVEIIALDKAAGLGNPTDALRDGHSTGGSAGTGLGAASRQSETFDVASWPGRGTAILARVKARPSGRERAAGPLPLFGSVAVPVRGEEVCGDAVALRREADGWIAMVADGLGHGPQAAAAGGEAVRLFMRSRETRPRDIMASLHAGLRHTRGGAVAVARYEAERGVLVFSGIGNIAGAVVGGAQTRRTVSLAGTAGHVARRFGEFEYPFDPGSLLVMCSDGIGTSWTLDGYPGLNGAHPSLIAAVLYRDFTRVRDDATVLVVREAAP